MRCEDCGNTKDVEKCNTLVEFFHFLMYSTEITPKYY